MGAQQGDVVALGLAQQEVGRNLPLGNDETGNVQGAQLTKVFRRPLRRQVGEIAQLGGTKDLDAVRVQVEGISGQGQAGLLDPGYLNRFGKTTLPRQQFQIESSFSFAQQLLDTDSSSSAMIRLISSLPFASSSRCRTIGLFSSLEMRASIFR
jgi:hypothetical protein